jgi:tRNA 2-thiocytidine biosynthesis protein TtcA
MFTGRLSALPAVTYSSKKEFRLIRPLVFVNEKITTEFASLLGAPVIPCGCSQKTGTVRRSLRDIFADLEEDYPHLKENLLTAMGNLDPQRLLDVRYLSADGEVQAGSSGTLLPVLTSS